MESWLGPQIYRNLGGYGAQPRVLWRQEVAICILYLNIPHCNIYAFVSYRNHFWPKGWSHTHSVPWENCHIWFFGMPVPLHFFHYFQTTIYSLQGCKGPQMVFDLRTRNPRTIACWLCYPHTNTPTLARRIDAPPPSYPQPRRVSWRVAMRIDDTNLILNKTSTDDGVDGCMSIMMATWLWRQCRWQRR